MCEYTNFTTIKCGHVMP